LVLFWGQFGSRYRQSSPRADGAALHLTVQKAIMQRVLSLFGVFFCIELILRLFTLGCRLLRW
jgi:hypothetical protein